MNKAQLIEDLIAEDRGATIGDCGTVVSSDSIFSLIEKTVCTFHEMPYEVYKMEQYRQVIKSTPYYDTCSCVMCGNQFVVGIRTGNKGYSCSQKCMGELKTKRRLLNALVSLISLRYYDRKYIGARLEVNKSSMWKYIKLAMEYRSANKYVFSLQEYIQSKVKSGYIIKQSQTKQTIAA